VQTEDSTLYYVCLNHRCPKHRAVFAAGDPEHEQCERKVLDLNEEPPAASRWPLYLGMGAAAAALTGAVLVSRALLSGRKAPEDGSFQPSDSDLAPTARPDDVTGT
jgi:hypothetical protein